MFKKVQHIVGSSSPWESICSLDICVCVEGMIFKLFIMDNFKRTNAEHPLNFNNYQLMVNIVSSINLLPTPRLF